MRNEFSLFVFKFLFVLGCIGCACGEKSAITLVVISSVMGVYLDAINCREKEKNGGDDGKV